MSELIYVSDSKSVNGKSDTDYVSTAIDQIIVGFLKYQNRIKDKQHVQQMYFMPPK